MTSSAPADPTSTTPRKCAKATPSLNFPWSNSGRQTATYLSEAGYPEAAANLDAELVNAAADAIQAHLAAEGNLIPDAVAKDLIAA